MTFPNASQRSGMKRLCSLGGSSSLANLQALHLRLHSANDMFLRCRSLDGRK